MARTTSEKSILLFLAVLRVNSENFYLEPHERACPDPQAPTWVRATSHNPTSFALSWGGMERNPPSCSLGYRVCLHGPSSSYRCHFVSCEALGGCTANNMAWLSDGSPLQTAACADYTATVSAVFDFLGVDGRISPAKAVTFQAAPEGVTNLTAVETTGNQTRLQWGASTSPCINHYTLSWCSVSSPWATDCLSSNRTLSIDQTSFSILGLAPCTIYRVGVATVSGVSGPHTDSTIIVTTPSTGVGAVRHLSVTGVGSEVSLNWDARQQDRTCTADYEVCWRNETGSDTCRLDKPGALLHLHACATYNVSVRAVDVGNDTSPPVSALVHTGAEKVRNLNATEVGAHSATLTWAPPATWSCAREYIVAWCAQMDANDPPCEPSARSNLPLNATRHIVSGLRPCLPHRVSITASATAESHSAASTVLLHTSLDELGPPQNVTVNVVSSAVTMVRFLPPKDTGMCIANYTGCLREVGDPGAIAVCLPAANKQYWVNWDNHTKACTNYTLELTVFSTDNRNASTMVSFTSGASEVEGLKVNNMTSNSSTSSARLTWEGSPYSECVEHQLVTWARTDGNGTAHQASIPRDAGKYIIEGLDPCTEYGAGVMRQAPTPTTIKAVTFYSASNVTAVKDATATVTCAADGATGVVSFTARDSPACVHHYSVCWGLHNASSNWTCKNVVGYGNMTVQLAGLNRTEEYGVSFTPVAPNHKSYNTTTTTIVFTSTCSGCSMLAPTVTVLAILFGLARAILNSVQQSLPV